MPCYIAFCGPSGSTIFFTSSHKRHELPTKAFDAKMRVLIISTNLSKAILLVGKNERDNTDNPNPIIAFRNFAKEPK